MIIDLRGDEHEVVTTAGSDWAFQFTVKNSKTNTTISMEGKDVFAIIMHENQTIETLSVENGGVTILPDGAFQVIKKFVLITTIDGKTSFSPSIENLTNGRYSLLLFVRSNNMTFRLPIRLKISITENSYQSEEVIAQNTQQLYFDLMLSTNLL